MASNSKNQPVSTSPVWVLQTPVAAPRLCTWMLGTEFKFSCLHDKQFTGWIIFPVHILGWVGFLRNAYAVSQGSSRFQRNCAIFYWHHISQRLWFLRIFNIPVIPVSFLCVLAHVCVCVHVWCAHSSCCEWIRLNEYHCFLILPWFGFSWWSMTLAIFLPSCRPFLSHLWRNPQNLFILQSSSLEDFCYWAVGGNIHLRIHP